MDSKTFQGLYDRGGGIIFGVRADLNLLQRMGQIISLGSKRVIRLSLMKCATLPNPPWPLPPTRARDVTTLKKILGDITDPVIRSMGLEALEDIIASEDQKPAARVSLDCPTITAGG